MADARILSGKQEHYLKRELLAYQTHSEIQDLASPTALQRFGAPFKSDYGEVAPVDSDFPICRYIFVHHVRQFPFLDQANEKEFWQDKLQVFLEKFANKNISSSEDRLEETKRKKLALKAEKLVEIMMVSGIPTASGYEERVRFSEIDPIDRGANEQGLVANMPEGRAINGWDVNVSSVRTVSVKHNLRYHTHAEFIVRVKTSEKELVVGRRYSDFVQLLRELRIELPGKVLPTVPRKNKSSMQTSWLRDDDASSASSISTQDDNSLRGFVKGHSRGDSISRSRSPRASGDFSPRPRPVTLYRESQRVSLRAFLRTLLQNPQVAQSKTLSGFLLKDPITLNEEEQMDEERRKQMDEIRLEEQRKFYEIARQRARDLDVYMEKFRRDIVERNGLTELFKEIKEKQKIEDLSPQTKKFAEWLRIEVAATIYHIFLAEDNSSEVFAQAKKIHSLIPYTILKNIIRLTNPASVMAGVLDLFLAQPFGSRSLMQRMMAISLNDGIQSFQKSIESLTAEVKDPILCNKLKAFTEAEKNIKDYIRNEAVVDEVDIVVAILRSDQFGPELGPEQIGKVFNAYVAWNNAVENVDEEMKQGAQLFAHLKQLLKLYTRQRDKAMMLSMTEEGVTLQLFRDLFLIFYEPLIKVYKHANVYSSVTDFSMFMDDIIATVERAQNQDIASDPNQTVQSFIDLCARHEHNFYKFVHEVHVHDNGLFEALMGWIENILRFLREGPKGGKLDMNALFQGAIDMSVVEKDKAIGEIDALIKWHYDRKRWHEAKTRQKMAADGADPDAHLFGTGTTALTTSDFGIDAGDLDDLDDSDGLADDIDAEDSDDDKMDPIELERKKRSRRADHLRRRAGEPAKPTIEELPKLQESFLSMLRMVLAE